MSTGGIRQKAQRWVRRNATQAASVRRAAAERKSQRRIGWVDRIIHAINDNLNVERDRWSLWAPVAFGCGIGGYFSLKAEPDWAATAALFAVALMLWFAVRRGTLRVALAGFLVVLACGFVAAKWRTDTAGTAIVPDDVGPLSLVGFVERIEHRVDRDVRLTVRPTGIAGWPRSVERPRRVRFSSRAGLPEGLRVGDRIRALVKLSPPPRPARPGDYDFARRAYFAGLGGVGFALSATTITDGFTWSPRRLGQLTGVRALAGP